jgi:hypothetical protein
VLRAVVFRVVVFRVLVFRVVVSDRGDPFHRVDLRERR